MARREGRKERREGKERRDNRNKEETGRHARLHNGLFVLLLIVMREWCFSHRPLLYLMLCTVMHGCVLLYTHYLFAPSFTCFAVWLRHLPQKIVHSFFIMSVSTEQAASCGWEWGCGSARRKTELNKKKLKCEVSFLQNQKAISSEATARVLQYI